MASVLERQELRWDFDGLQPEAMTGGTVAQETIGNNIMISVQTHFNGRRCRGFGADLESEVAGRIGYSDAFVICTPLSPRTTVVRDPIVVFEVISESTSRIDRIEKLLGYGATRPYSAT